MTGIVIWIVLIALAAALLWMIINFTMNDGGGSATGASVFSDFQNQEKRNAMETVIEEKAGKKRFEQESGDKEKLDEQGKTTL
jgi:hypothetical protein